MTQTLTRTPDDKVEAGIAPFIIRFDPVIEMTKELFEQFCAMNDDMRIELTAEGIIEIMPSTFGFTGNRNIKVAAQLENWTTADDSGIAFDSSTGFTLPNGAVRSSDASWVSNARYDLLLPEEKDSFTPLCPDFVVELRSLQTGSASCRRRWKSTWQTVRDSAGCLTRWNNAHIYIAPVYSLRYWINLILCLLNPNCQDSHST